MVFRFKGRLIFSRWWFQTFLNFTPKIGEDFQFDDRILQMGSNQNFPSKRSSFEVADLFVDSQGVFWDDWGCKVFARIFLGCVIFPGWTWTFELLSQRGKPWTGNVGGEKIPPIRYQICVYTSVFIDIHIIYI